MNVNEIKVPLKTAINLLEQWGNDERAMELLRALLADLDAEPPKPTGEPAFTVEEIIKWCSFAETTSHKADRVIEFINDPKDGIVATTRKEEK